MAFVTVAATAALVGTGLKAAGGIGQAISSGIKAKQAKEEAEAAQKQLDKQKSMFMHLDTSNPYLNMENVADDLVVNQQQAEFEAQQQAQQQANIMDQMAGAAGGSGIAALAQTMANQGAQNLQASSASIGQQESANQMMQAREAARIQGLERKGELISRQAEHDKLSTAISWTADDLANAKEEQAMHKQRMMEGVQQVGQAAGDFFTGGIGGNFAGTGVGDWFQQGMKRLPSGAVKQP
tara:strand:- start:1618 stop:2334 length:717 start_codon:yes stop_codon:yes gene_type:complete